jgi:serine/threonine protein kinase/WD40 repeat protein
MTPINRGVSAIDDYVRARLTNPDLSPAEAVELITRDLERHWQKGERVLVETYLPFLAGPVDADLRMDLIYNEVLVREAAGDRPGPSEYSFRFPDLAERIQTQFLLHRTLLDAPAEPAPEPIPTPPTPRRQFAHTVPGYEILEELGSGGMGIVYKGRHQELGRVVALKVLRSDTGEREAELRLRREAEALAQLQHPHIVQIYEVGVADGQPYLALEYVGGGTLADRFRAGLMPARDLAALVRMVALAVHAAHEQGLIHRDLKPANILLPESPSLALGSESATSTRSGVIPEPPVKVTDFGLVKRVDQSDLSRTGEVLGTPSYMAPEQATGKKAIGPATDVYALGVILYEGLVGRPPFQGDTAISLLTQIAGADPIPPSRLRRGVARDLESVVLKCLEKAPGKRYTSAADLAEDLRRFLAGEPTRARPVTSIGRVVKLARRHPLPTSLLALIAVSLIGGLTGVLWQWREAVTARDRLQTALRSEAEQRRQAEQSLYQSRIAQAGLLWDKGQAAQARALLADCPPREGEDDPRGWEWYYLNRLFHAEVHTFQLPGAVNSLALCPSLTDGPDGLIFALGPSRQALRTWSPDTAAGFLELTRPPSLRPGPALSGTPVAIAVQPPSLGADGKKKAGTLVAWIVTGRKLVVADRSDGRTVRTITLPDESKAVCFTPEGTLLVGRASHVDEWDPATGEKIADHAIGHGLIDILVLHPFGSLLAVGSAPAAKLTIYERKSDRLLAEVPPAASGLSAVAFSPDGRRLATGYQTGQVSLWDVDTWREVHRLQAASDAVFALAFHPSSRQLAFSGASHVIRLWDVTAGRVAAFYRGHDSEVLTLTFGPRGDWLASGSRDGSVRIWDTTRDPNGLVLRYHPIEGGFAFDSPPAGLAVQTLNCEDRSVAWLTAEGRPLVQNEVHSQSRPGEPTQRTAWLRHGRVATIRRTDPRTVAIWGADGDRPRQALSNEGAVQAVAADAAGRRLAWAAVAGPKSVTIRRWDMDTETESAPIRLDVSQVRSLAVESGGRWLAAVTIDNDASAEMSLWVLDTTGQQPPHRVLTDPGVIGVVSFRPDGVEMIIAVGDTVSVYRVKSWELIQRFSCLPQPTSIAYSPDGRRFAAASDDGVVTLIDRATGMTLFQLHGLGRARARDVSHTASVGFSPDGAWLVSSNWDGTFSLWDGSRPLAGR